MAELISELIVSLDACARGTQSPGYYGFDGPDLAEWRKTNSAQPHRMLIGRRTYEMLASLPHAARDDGWRATAEAQGWLVSSTVKQTDWPHLKVVAGDLEGFVRELKQDDGPELRILGSLSIVRQLATAGLLDRIKLVICPLVVPKTGVEPTFEGWPDTAFEMASMKVLDGRLLLVDYRLAGAPPSTKAAP
jgi:dihydrofolate reductase